MNKYLEKLAKMNIKKTVDLISGKRLRKAEAFAVKTRPNIRKHTNAVFHSTRVKALTDKSRKIAGGSAAVAGAASAGVAYKASKDKK